MQQRPAAPAFHFSGSAYNLKTSAAHVLGSNGHMYRGVLGRTRKPHLLDGDLLPHFGAQAPMSANVDGHGSKANEVRQVSIFHMSQRRYLT